MPRKKNGFTLMELLVVISVIAMLMGILMPALGKARMLGRRTVCKSNLRNLGYAFRMYLDEYGDVMPPAAMMPSLENPSDPNSKEAITVFLLPYVSGEKNVFKCPGDKGKGYQNYFLAETTSYWYRERLGGEKLKDSRPVRRDGEANVEIMYDYETFHGEPGKVGAKNYLYADLHVGDLKKQ